jgi:hypothetical protein
MINKITVGFVVQRFDPNTRRFVEQSFVAADHSTWEDSDGNELDPTNDKDAELIYGKGGVDEPSMNLEMVQPTSTLPILFSKGDRVLVTPADDGSDPTNEFMGVVIGIGNKYVQVKDQDDNVFDCDFSQVKPVK